MGEVAAGGGTEEGKGGASGGKAVDERGGGGLRCGVFLPQVYVRVLLVEADDATRQIIAALLRNCSYRVATAADGLKAWEILKEKSQNIDLVLTEVDLPTISGYGLLSMIMEHGTCKNIPVIMMSSHDSINMVLKCMIKGAADFLIKPIRKNELRNLWQHVWRRHLSDCLPRGIYEHQDGNITRRKSDVNSENNAASSHSRDCIVLLQENRGCSEKGCDSQSSCVRPDMDARSECTQNLQDNIQPYSINASVVNDTRNHKQGVCDKLDKKLHMHQSDTEGCMGDANIQLEEKKKKICERKPCREFDLIKVVDKHSHCSHQLKNCSELQCDISNDAETLDDAKDQKCKPLLDLTLRSHQSISNDNLEKDEFNMLNHSNSSAFSSFRYNRTVPSPSSASNVFKTELVNYLSDANLPSGEQGLFHGNTSQCNCAPLNLYLGDADFPISGLHNQCGRVPCSHLGLLPISVPMSGTGYGPFSSYGPAIQPLFYTQSGTALWGVKPMDHASTHSSLSHQYGQETLISGWHGDPHGQNAQKNFYETQKEQTCNIESSKENSHASSVTGPSRSCTHNGSISHARSSGCGSVCDGRNVNLMQTNVFGGTEGYADRNPHDETKLADFHRSVHREAALIKFRLKRKERCHEKIHCQRGKKLAEERPRVRG